MERVFRDSGPLPYIISSLGLLAYWIYFESTTGQSIGKRLLKIKTTDLDGRKIDTKSAVIESIGKALATYRRCSRMEIYNNKDRGYLTE